VAVQKRAALKEGSSASTCGVTAFASSMRPSLASAAASTLRDTLELGVGFQQDISRVSMGGPGVETVGFQHCAVDYCRKTSRCAALPSSQLSDRSHRAGRRQYRTELRLRIVAPPDRTLRPKRLFADD
jgi:hypothetical protein